MEVLLTKRQKQIVAVLERQSSFVTSSVLAHELCVSEKTIQNEISTINEKTEKAIILSQKGKGYYLNQEYALDHQIQNEKEDRRDIKILKELLMEKCVDFYELSDRFFISTSTLNKDIAHLNRMLHRTFPNIVIQRKHNHLSLNCDDLEKRKILAYFLLEESENQSFDLDVLNLYFDTIDVKELSALLMQFMKSRHEDISDFNVLSMLLHILIIMSEEENISYMDLNLTGENEWSTGFLKLLAKQMDFHFSEAGILLMDKVFKKSNMRHSRNFDEYMSFLTIVCREILDIYSVNFNEDIDLKESLALHLSNLEIRCQHHRQIRNPLLAQLKQKFVLVYDIAVYFSLRFQEMTGYTPDEDEIGFIALHVLNAIQKLRITNVRIALINPYGSAVYESIVSRLNGISDVEIIGSFSMFDHQTLYKEKPDLIISLVSLATQKGFEVYKMENWIDETEYLHIEKILKNIRVKRTYENIIVRNYFFEELFSVREDLKTKEDVIHFLCEQLRQYGYVDKEFEGQIYQREAIAPTCFGQPFSIPHPTHKIAKKNGIAVVILKQAISWDGFDVRIVLMFSLHKSFDQVPKLYDYILTAMDDEIRFKKILNVEDFNSFMQLIM